MLDIIFSDGWEPVLMNLVKVSDSDYEYDVKKLANERPVYTVIDEW